MVARSRRRGKGEGGSVGHDRPARSRSNRASSSRPISPGLGVRVRPLRRLPSCRGAARTSPARAARRRPTSAARSRGCGPAWRSTVAEERPSLAAIASLVCPTSFHTATCRSSSVSSRPSSRWQASKARRSRSGGSAGRGPAQGRLAAGTHRAPARASSVKTSRAVAESSTLVRSTRLASLSWPRSIPRHTLLNARAAASSSSAGTQRGVHRPQPAPGVVGQVGEESLPELPHGDIPAELIGPLQVADDPRDRARMVHHNQSPPPTNHTLFTSHTT